MAKQTDVVVLGTREGRRWTAPGGRNDDDSITIYVATSAADGVLASREFEVRIPLEVADDGGLSGGPVEITEMT